MKNIAIETTAKYVPTRVATNDDLAEFIDTSDEWIRSRTGIEQRHISIGQNTSDLCTHVAKQLVANAQISPDQIDLIVVATMSPDALTPATAAIVQGNIGAVNAVAFDISAACSGFVYALNLASKYLDGQRFKRALVIGGEVLSKLMDWSDRTSCVLFGDGAAGVLLTATSQTESQFIASDLQTLGHLGDKITAGKTEPLADFPAQSDLTHSPFVQEGRAVYTFATHNVPASIKKAVAAANMELADVDWFVLHQANFRIIKQVAKRLGMPLERFANSIAKYGNTSGASVPLALDDLVASGQLKRGQTVVLCGFGGGLTIGTQIIKY